MALEDKPGALAKVATVLGDAGISIDRMRQYRHDDTTAPVLIVTHKTDATRSTPRSATCRGSMCWRVTPVALRIETV